MALLNDKVGDEGLEAKPEFPEKYGIFRRGGSGRLNPDPRLGAAGQLKLAG